MTHAVALITDEVRARVRREGVDLSSDRELAHQYVHEEVRRYSERALGGSVPLLADEDRATSQIVATLTGFGALQPYFDDAEVEEIWINAPDRVFIARGGVSERTAITLSDTEVRDLVERMLQSTGRRVDLSSPFVDASLPDVIYPRPYRVSHSPPKSNSRVVDIRPGKMSATWQRLSSLDTNFKKRCCLEEKSNGLSYATGTVPCTRRQRGSRASRTRDVDAIPSRLMVGVSQHICHGRPTRVIGGP